MRILYLIIVLAAFLAGLLSLKPRIEQACSKACSETTQAPEAAPDESAPSTEEQKRTIWLDEYRLDIWDKPANRKPFFTISRGDEQLYEESFDGTNFGPLAEPDLVRKRTDFKVPLLQLTSDRHADTVLQFDKLGAIHEVMFFRIGPKVEKVYSMSVDDQCVVSIGEPRDHGRYHVYLDLNFPDLGGARPCMPRVMLKWKRNHFVVDKAAMRRDDTTNLRTLCRQTLDQYRLLGRDSDEVLPPEFSEEILLMSYRRDTGAAKRLLRSVCPNRESRRKYWSELIHEAKSREYWNGAKLDD